MTEVYIIRNQDQLYLDKQGEWVDGSASHTLYRTAFKDEALNTKVELSVRHPQLRLTIVPGAVDEKGHLALAESEATARVIDQSTSTSFSAAAGAAADPDLDHKPDPATRTTDTKETCA